MRHVAEVRPPECGAGRLSSEGKDQTGQVSTHAAFDSPDTLADATSFLRQYAQDTAAQAAVAVIPKHKIAFPQASLL